MDMTLCEGVAVLALHGEHDLDTADAVRAATERAVSERRPCVFDLRATEFVDSTIMAVLLGTQRRCSELGVGFATAVSDDEMSAVRRIVELTGIGPTLAVSTDIDAAIATARSAGA
jgi:anti-anti-sigma factor